MASFMGLFRRWLDPPDEDNTNNNDNNQQREPTTTKDNQQERAPNDEPNRISEVSRFQRETERDKVFDSVIENLQTELNSSKDEVIALRIQHSDDLATKESEYETLSSELRTQIHALNNLLMAERRKSERLERTSEDQMTNQTQQLQMQLQMQQKSNAKQLKELQGTIVKQEIVVTNERAENLKLRNDYQRVVDAKKAEGHQLSQQLIEVSRRLEDEVKVCVAEKKRREMAETILDSQTKRMKELDVQHKDTVRQLNVFRASLEKQTKEREEEQTRFYTEEKQYKETLAQKESDYGKLELCLATMQCRKNELNSERRKIEALEQEISESEDQVLQVARKHRHQLNILQEKVVQLTKEVKNEKRMKTEVEKQRDEALTSKELNRQKFNRDLTQLNNRFESRSIALEAEKDIRQGLQIELKEQKEIECQKDAALEKEKKAKEALQIQLQEQKKVGCQMNRALEKEKKAREAFKIQLQKQKGIVCQKGRALEMETKAKEALQIQLQEKEKVGCQMNRALEKEKKTREALKIQLQEQKKIDCQKDTAFKMEKKTREALKIQLQKQKEIECQNARALEMEKNEKAVLQNELKEKEKVEGQKEDKLQGCLKQLSDYGVKNFFLRKELETQRQKNVLSENDHHEEKDIEGDGENLSSAVAEESPPQRSNKEDDVLESQNLTMELSVLRQKLEKVMEELDKERQTRLDIQEQTKQLRAERKKAAEETEKLTSRITELEAEKRSRAQASDDQNDQQVKRDETQPNEILNVEPNDTNDHQVIEHEDNENLPLQSAGSVTRQSEQTEMQSIQKAKQLDEQIKRISELSEVKRKKLKLSTQGRHVKSTKHQLLLQPLQFVQQTITREQIPSKQNKPDFDPPTTSVDQDQRETLTVSQDNTQSDNSNGKATIDAEVEAGEDSTPTTSSRLNSSRLDENRIQKLRDRPKTLQPVRHKEDVAHSLPGIQDDESQDKQQQDILTRIKEEPMTANFEDNETEVDIHPADDDDDDDDEDPPPKTKKRRLEDDSNLTDDVYCNSAPYDHHHRTTGMVRVIEIKSETDFKQEPLEEQIVRTPTITDSKDGSKEPGSITKQEPTEEREQGIKQEPEIERFVFNRKRLRAPTAYRSMLKKPIEHTAADSKTNKLTPAARKDIESSLPKEPAVHPSSQENARLVHTLIPRSLKTAVTGVAVLNGSLFVVSETNSVVEVYDSTTFTFSGKVSVEGLTNPQSLTSCPLNACLYILDRTQPNNAIYRLGLAPDWRHHKWPIGKDFGALASTSSGSILLSCLNLRIKEFSSNGKLIRQFRFGQKSASDLRLFGAVQLPRTSGTSRTAADTLNVDESQFAISYSHRRTGPRRVCTVDGNGQVADTLLKYNGQCTSQHLIVGRQTGALFLADFGMGEVFQWNAELKNCRKIERKKNSGFRPLRICLDQNDKRIIIAEVCLDNDGSTTMSATSKLSVYDL